MSAHPAHSLVSWYEIHRRLLPWRETRDPYRILVSETMLQQTRVETVIPYYHAFLAAFPTVEGLAAADEDEVLKRWQGLGYYSRARNLHRAAKAVSIRHAGNIPHEEGELRALPGVGEYTTGAVMSIAFNQPIPAVDGNVLRVMTRYLGISEPTHKQSVKHRIREVVRNWLSDSEPRLLTQAFMELGALVCVPRNPRCEECPLGHSCIARRDDLTAVLPIRPSKKPRKQIEVIALWLEADGKVLVERRPAEGLLAGMWQLPAVELTPDQPVSPEAVLYTMKERCTHSAGAPSSVVADPSATYGEPQQDPSELQSFALVAREHHVFTHLEWQVRVYRPVGVDEPCRSLQRFGIIEPGDPYSWVLRSEMDTLTWPRVYEKIVSSMSGQPL